MSTIKTNKSCFASSLAGVAWYENNCLKCKKAVSYNNKLGKLPKYKCAVQRDVDSLLAGEMEISTRSYNIAICDRCSLFVAKYADTCEDEKRIENENVAGKSLVKVGDVVKPTSLKKQSRLDSMRTLADTKKRRAVMYGLKVGTKLENESTKVKKAEDKIFTTPECAFNASQLIKIRSQYASIIEVVVGSISDIADSYIKDLVYELKAKKLFKHEIKYIINQAVKEYNNVFTAIRLRVKNERLQIYIDTLDEIASNTKVDIEKLYWSYKNLLDRNKVKNSDFKARVEVINLLLFYATCYFTAISSLGAERHRLRIGEYCKDMNPERIYGVWNHFAKKYCSYTSGIAEQVENDSNIILARKIIESKLTDTYEVEKNCVKIVNEHKLERKNGNSAIKTLMSAI